MFRTSDRIAAVATDFVLRNSAQTRKTARPMRKSEGPIMHVGLPGQEGFSLLMEALDGVASDAVDATGNPTCRSWAVTAT